MFKHVLTTLYQFLNEVLPMLHRYFIEPLALFYQLHMTFFQTSIDILLTIHFDNISTDPSFFFCFFRFVVLSS